MNPRRLYRSHDRMLAGVAGGMAEYLDLDPTIIRIGWIVVGLASAGMALIAYFLLAIVIPSAPYPYPGGAWSAPVAPNAWQGQAATPGAASAQPAPPSNAWSQPGAPGGAWQASGTEPWVRGSQVDAWANPPASPEWHPQAPVWAAQPAPRPASRGLGIAAITGVVLVVIGIIALAGVILPGIHTGRVIGPAAILALGAALLVASVRSQPQAQAAGATTSAAPSAVAGEAPGAGRPAAPQPVATADPTATADAAATADPATAGGPTPPVSGEMPSATPPEPSESDDVSRDEPRAE